MLAVSLFCQLSLFIIKDLVFVPQISNLFSKLSYVTGLKVFNITISVDLCNLCYQPAGDPSAALPSGHLLCSQLQDQGGVAAHAPDTGGAHAQPGGPGLRR